MIGLGSDKKNSACPTFTDPCMESGEACEGEANDESNGKGGEGRGKQRDDQTDGGVPPDALAPLLLVHHQDAHLRCDKMFMRRDFFLQKLPLPSWNWSEAK